jgi:hypothetical protein
MKGIAPERDKAEDKKPAGPSVAVPLTHGGPEPELA